jgi:hypothetical protein
MENASKFKLVDANQLSCPSNSPKGSGLIWRRSSSARLFKEHVLLACSPAFAELGTPRHCAQADGQYVPVVPLARGQAAVHPPVAGAVMPLRLEGNYCVFQAEDVAVDINLCSVMM